MAQEYRYPLTRVCLRGGTMTLPRAMLDLFPDSGEVTVVDTATGEELTAYMSHPRVVAGLAPLFRAHALDVNDELVVERLADGRFGLTPLPRRGQEPSAEAEEEVTGRGAAEAQGEGAPDHAEAAPATEEAKEAEETEEVDEPEAPQAPEAAPAPSEPAPEAAPPNLDPRASVREAESALAELDAERGAGGAETPAAGAGLGALLAEPEPRPREEGREAATTDAGAGERGGRQESLWGAGNEAPPPARGALFEDEEAAAASLEAVALATRLRRFFAPLGYRIEPLAAGVVYLHAEMGRRRYRVLVQLHRAGARLDWAGLLSRRRASPANYLAVVGDRADLVRLTGPADLARATLWSWEALGRLAELNATVPVTPLDLESHFARDGLFEQGLKRFESSVAARVAERGDTSEVLARLARLKAPSVFLLEELAQDAGLSRDAVLRILERLSEAPLHLVAKVANGEFLLRQPVDTALASLAAYAESLRKRLPSGRREVVAGLDDDEGEVDEAAQGGGSPGEGLEGGAPAGAEGA